MADEVEIRVLYEELQGILAQTPKSGRVFEEQFWKPFNDVVELLGAGTGDDYSRFRVHPLTRRGARPLTGRGVRPFVEVIHFRQIVNQLINHLHATYFSKEPPPFGTPAPSSVSVSTNVSQNQAVYFQMILDFQSAMDEKVQSFPDDSKEKQWWKNIKGSLGTITSLTQLLELLIKTAQESGLTLEQLKSIFS